MSSPQSGFITRPSAEIFGRHLGYGFAGAGVNTAIGNFTDTAVDLSFPGGLLGLLDWRRTYNSRSDVVGALGPGWSTSLSARLAAATGQTLHDAAGPVTFHDEDGRVLTFTPSEGGGFTRPQDLEADLARGADGSFTLAYNSGLVLAFDSAGVLTGRSLEGQHVALGYGGDGLLAHADHSSGWQLSFGHDANCRLSSIAASDGRTVSFGYTSGDASALLQSVTVPGGGSTRFEWSGAGQAAQISSITDPDGNQIVANTYDDPARRVSAQAFPGGSGAGFRYDATGVTTVTFTPPGAQVAFEADAQGRMIKVTGSDANASTFSYTDGGYLAAATTPGGAQLALARDGRGNLRSATIGGVTTTWAYDNLDRPVSMTAPDGALTTYRYDGDSHLLAEVAGPGGALTRLTADGGLITSHTGPDGGTTTFTYAGGNLSSVTDPAGLITTFSYDQAGRRTEMTTAPGITTRYSYDGSGRLESITNPAGSQTSYQYSPAGLVTSVTDPGGGITRYAYDDAGRTTSITDPVGRSRSFSYDINGNATVLTDPSGNRTTLDYDQFGRLTTMTGPDGAQTVFGYDLDGNQVSVQDPAGTTLYRFDSAGRPVSLTDAVGATTTYKYDVAGRPVAVTGPDGQTWNTGYDPAGNPALDTDPLGGQTRQTWSPGGHITTVTDPVGRVISYEHDQAGRVTAVTDGEGGVSRYVYDQQGRRIAVITPAGLITRHRYDAASRITATIDPRGWATRYEYDKRGNKTAVITPSGAVTRFRYDQAGQLTEACGPDGSVIGYGYDSSGRLISVTGQKDAVTRYGYDSAGRLISVTDPLGRTTRRDYDKAGNLATITDPDGHSQHFSYDAARQLTRRSADDGTEASYTYDKNGRRISMTDGTGTTQYAYDAAGRLIAVTEPNGDITSASYNQAGQRTGLTYPGGLTASYSYDLNGRLTGLTDSRAGTATYILDPDGRLLTEQLPGRQARRYHYDGGLVRRFTVYRDDHPVTDAAFTRDPEGGILSWREDEREHQYRYDASHQLINAASQDGELRLTYDAAGNRTSLRHGEDEVRYRYDDAGQLVATEAGGRRTEYRYDSSGRLVELSGGGQHVTIRYDGFGRSVTVTRTGPEQVAEEIHSAYNGDDLLVALTTKVIDHRRNSERQASVSYLWGSVNQIPEIFAQRAEPSLDNAEHDQPGRLSADFTYGYGRTFASWEHGNTVFQRDAFGSAVRTEDTQAWVQAREYTPFGAPADAPVESSPGPEHPRDGLPWPELPRFGYRGELALGPTIHLRARTYDAATGRFTTPDPLSLQPDTPSPVHPYAYANNDPLNLTDPLGTLPLPRLAELVGAFTPNTSANPVNCASFWKTLPPLPPNAPFYPFNPSEALHPSPAMFTRLNADLNANNFAEISRILHIKDDGLLFPPWTGPQNTTSPLLLGEEWVTGAGPRDQYFYDNDPFTRTLMRDTNVSETRQEIRTALKCGGPYSWEHDYQDPHTVKQLINDLAGVFGLPDPTGTPSNAADGFLGSYTLRWAAVPTSRTQATAFFTVNNTSDLNSFAHPEITKYLILALGFVATVEFPFLWPIALIPGILALGNNIDGLAPVRNMPGGLTTQTVKWREAITNY